MIYGTEPYIFYLCSAPAHCALCDFISYFKDKISHLIKKPNRKCIWRGKRKAVSSLCIENCIFVPPNY